VRSAKYLKLGVATVSGSYAHEMRFRLRDFCFLFVEPATGATEWCASAFSSTSMSGGLSGKYLRCGERLASLR